MSYAVVLAKDPTKMVGSIGLDLTSKRTKYPEIGYLIDEPYWGRG